MKQLKVVVLATLLATGFAKPNQAAPKLQTVETIKIYIAGQVKQPGSYELTGKNSPGKWRLIDAIAVAGGLAANPESLRFSVQRGDKKFPADWFGIISATDPKKIVPLQSGDVVIVDVVDPATELTVPPQWFNSRPKPEQKGSRDKGQFEFNGSTIRIVPLAKKGATQKQK